MPTKIIEQVKPGDLITAEFWNSLVATVNDLSNRVDALATNATGGGAVRIAATVPAGSVTDPVRVGADLQVLGMNFGFSAGLQRVFLDSIPITTFKLGSRDDRLVLTVPTLPVLALTGSNILLRVENGRSIDTRNLFIIPNEETLEGDVDVIWKDIANNPQPNPIVPSQPAEFAYQLHSRANLAARFTIEPLISVSEWQVNLEVWDATTRTQIDDRQIELAPGQTRDFFVRLKTLPTNAGGRSFTLAVTAHAAGVSGVDARGFTVNTPIIVQDNTIHLDSVEFEPIDSDTGEIDPTASFSTNTIRIKIGTRGFVKYAVRFDDPGRYLVSVEPSAGIVNWEILRTNTTPAIYNETAPNVSENPRFYVLAKLGASSAGKVTFRIKREGATNPGQFREYNLILIA